MDEVVCKVGPVGVIEAPTWAVMAPTEGFEGVHETIFKRIRNIGPMLKTFEKKKLGFMPLRASI